MDDFSGQAAKRQRTDEVGGWASGAAGGKGGRWQQGWNDGSDPYGQNGGKGGKKGKGKKGKKGDQTAEFNAQNLPGYLAQKNLYGTSADLGKGKNAARLYARFGQYGANKGS